MKRIVLILLMVVLFDARSQNVPLFRNPSAPIEKRVENLLDSLTLKEKISLLGYTSPGVERLKIPSYNWWNEALHGIARGGEATVFPQAIAMAASFNPDLVKKVGDAISTEARAKFNITTKNDWRLQYMGINFWTPNINLFRDPRWGRGQETYGEDPFLTATIGTAFVKGLQGNESGALKTAACAKHFAVHSGPEATRHEFNAIVDEKDIRETYLYAFKKLVDNGVEAVMCGYNRLNDQPCCINDNLLHNILRKEWNFKGHVVTDCWALDDIWLRHKVVPTRLEVAVAAIKAGVNLDCANILQEDVVKAVEQGLLSEQEVNEALKGTLRTQIKLGYYDSPANSKFASYGADSVHNAGHIALAHKIAQESMVLLKNDGVLPLDRKKYSTLMVLGPNSSSLEPMLGNYHGISGEIVTYAEGISKSAGAGVGVQYDQGCDFTDTSHFGGIWAASNSDATIAVLGLTPLLEGEDGDAFLSPSGGDKVDLGIPRSHLAFLKKLRESHKKPIILVVTAGSAIDVKELEPYADAVILAWYSGEQGGNALADIIFGDVSPSGRLPVTFYSSIKDLPDYSNYAMQGRTYRYFKGAPAYPFGFGLGYAKFSYDWNEKPKAKYGAGDTIKFSVKVKNVSRVASGELVQAYIEYPNLERMPLKELKAFQKTFVKGGEETIIKLAIPSAELQKWNLSKSAWELYKGKYKLHIGKNSAESYLEQEFTAE